jgi:plasmid stabilization system protein ParE
MEKINIEYAQYAQWALDDIFSYYSACASDSIAIRVCEEILDAIEYLAVDPKTRSIEPFAKDFKFILCYDFKIIYRKIDNIILIADIFHTSENPDKIKQRIQ